MNMDFSIYRRKEGNPTMTVTESPIQPSLRNTVLHMLRSAILTGQLTAGSRLSESELARTLKASRSPVREAIAHLEQEGLVERFPNRGAFVTDVLSKRAIGELAGLRSVLECYAIQLIGASEQIPDFELIRAVTVEMDQAAFRKDLDVIADIDFRFHKMLVALAGHQKLFHAWSGVADQYWALYLPQVQRLGHDIEHWGRNHRRILGALEDRRPAVATMYLQYNILNSAEELMDELSDTHESMVSG
jgi:DNA-binding GntR family transcriptional regulator